jgi:cobalamin biosynthesis Co2+ chelatase CbiK
LKLNKNEFSAYHACINFVFSEKIFKKIIVGVDSFSQFKSLIESVSNANFFSAPSFLRVEDESLINPMYWPKK